jgi:ABC-type molybdate transport system substrate-binding protein
MSNLLSSITRRVHETVVGVLGAEQVIQASVNESCLILPSASRAATVNSDTQHNFRQRGVIVTVNVTSAGSGSITATIQREDPAAGWVDMLASAAITTDSATTLTIYPGFTPSANAVASAVIPRKWRVRVVHNNSNAITYAVGVSTLS